MVSKSAVIGIDLGASESYVAYVGKGIVDVVQNEVSKRATSTLVGFTDRERLLGDAALAQIRSNAKNSCRNFKHLLGRKIDAPDLEKEHFWSTSKLCPTDDGYCGYDVTYKGEPRQMSATVITAMYLTKLKEITESWCAAKVSDVVLACPSTYADDQRQALIDAAKIAGLNVLRLMNEHTATALAYGIYRSNEFDPEKPMRVVFCSMGHSLFSVSVVEFVRGKLTVVCEKSAKVGGRDLDECLMREFGAQFQKKTGNDPLANKKSLFKLEDAVQKTKKVLSANAEAPVTVECLMEDEDFSSTITRADLEKMCAPAIASCKRLLEEVKELAGLTSAEQIDFIEMTGGGSRVPWVKQICSEAFWDKPLATTMNQEESVARGCALMAAMLSPLYKVRDFRVEDFSPFPVSIGWTGSGAVADKEDDGDAKMSGAEGEYKTATVFPEKSLMNVLKMLTFYRSGPFELRAEIADESKLLPLTGKELGTFKIELPPSKEPRKVKVKAKLTLHGTFALEGAHLVEEEEYEEVIKEKRELPAEPDSPMDEARGDEAEKPEEGREAGEEKKEEGDAPMPDQDGDAEMADKENGDSKEGEKKEEKKVEKKKKEPKFEWVEVTKKKKRTKKTDLKVTRSGAPGLSAQVLQQRMDEETAMVAETREILETDEKRNDLEAYIFTMRDKIAESGEYGAFISPADRERFSSELAKTEDWGYDNPESAKAQLIDKLDELKVTGEPVAWRFKESGMREDWAKAVRGTVANYRSAAETPGDKYGHIAPERLAKISAACGELEKWLAEAQAKQASVPKYEKPVLICAEMEKKNQELAKTADEILKEAKPAPPKAQKKAEPPPPPPKEAEEAEEAKPEAAAKEEGAEEEAAEAAAPADGEAHMDVD